MSGHIFAFQEFIKPELLTKAARLSELPLKIADSPTCYRNEAERKVLQTNVKIFNPSDKDKIIDLMVSLGFSHIVLPDVDDKVKVYHSQELIVGNIFSDKAADCKIEDIARLRIDSKGNLLLRVPEGTEITTATKVLPDRLIFKLNDI